MLIWQMAYSHPAAVGDLVRVGFDERSWIAGRWPHERDDIDIAAVEVKFVHLSKL